MIFGEDHTLTRLKWAFESCKNGAWGDEPDGETDAVCIRAADFNADLGALNSGERTLRSIDDATYRKVGLRAGDLVVEKSGGGERQLVGRSVVYCGPERAVCSNFLARCRPSNLATSDYLNYLMLGIYKARGTYPHIKQTTGIQNLDMASFLNTRVKLPPLETQRRIAAFLDEKTARIDALIARKQALLERLAEKRQAIITQAVTKGLDPAAPMKDSGIDWLGQIPAHWEVKRLASSCWFQSGKAHEPFIDPDGEYVCVNARFISTDGMATKRCTENLTPAEPGDILMVMSDLPNGRALARAFLVDDRDAYAVNQRVCRIRPSSGEPAYFSHQLNRNPQLLSYNDGKEQTHLSNTAFKQLLLLIPPLDEQQEIAAYLSNALVQVDAVKQRVIISLNTLQEYRSAVITSAVTGQIESLT